MSGSGNNEPVTTGTRMVTTNVRQLSDGNPIGTVLGQSVTDKIGFYGGTPVAQPSGFAELNVALGGAAGSVMTFSSAQSPSGVTTLTSAEYSITVQNGTGGTLTPATGDVMIVNKPTAQAGLGVGNVRQSGAGTIGLTFSNFTGTMITPTASQAYGIVGLRGLNPITAVLTPAAVAASTTAEQIFTVTGASVGDVMVVNKPTTQAGLDIAGVRVAGNNQVGINFVNLTAGVLTPTPGQTYTFFDTAGMDAVSNTIILALNSTLTPATVTAAQTGNIAVSSSNILADDTLMQWSKPTTQVSIAATGGHVVSAGVLALNVTNPTVTVATPTASEIYAVSMYRNAPAAPCVVYNTTLTPASVAANTTAEQTFVVTGVVAGSAVTVNWPAPTPGLGIMGARVSSANNVAITFCNATAAALTPAAGTYAVANFQALIDVTTGNAMVQSAAPADNGTQRLTDAIRTALGPQGLNLIAGA